MTVLLNSQADCSDRVWLIRIVNPVHLDAGPLQQRLLERQVQLAHVRGVVTVAVAARDVQVAGVGVKGDGRTRAGDQRLGQFGVEGSLVPLIWFGQPRPEERVGRLVDFRAVQAGAEAGVKGR